MSRSLASTSDSSIFFDANILLEVVLGRDKELLARSLLEKHTGTICISALSAHLVTHFGQAVVTFPVLRKFLSDYTILDLKAVDFEWAFTNIRNNDFEDALQIAVAVRNGCSDFITFDAALASAYKDLPSIKVQLAK